MASTLTKLEQYCQFKTPLNWRNIIMITSFHLLGLYAITLLPNSKLSNFIFLIFCGTVADTAISAGAHRLWTHKTYKATLAMRYFIMCCYMLGGQYSIVQWARDHRTHHKYTDTDADPHNASRGLFYSHVGWLMMKRHPDLKEKGKVIDVSDLWEDPVIRFHQKNIRASQNAFLAFLLVGEGWHNFHHTFPWDYRIGELGQGFQFTANVIDIFAWFGLAYDRKTASPDIIEKVKAKNDLPPNFEVPDNEGYDFDNINKM